jgi:glycosyltransferase involved in cell wall biosynthesis
MPVDLELANVAGAPRRLTVEELTPPGGRVLVVVPQPFYSDRGSPIALRQVVRGYLELDQEVDVVTFPLGENFEARGLRFFRAANPFRIRSVPVGFSIRKVLLDITLTLEMRKRLRSGSYTLVHALEESVFPAAWFAKAAGVPLLYDMHSRLSDGLRGVPGLRRGPLRRLALRLEHWLFRTAGTIVASKGLAAEVLDVHPTVKVFEWQFSGTLDEATGPTPSEIREDLDIPSGSPVVLYSGTFTRYQGIDLFLEAAAVATSRVPDATFLLVGSEPKEERAVRETVARLKLEEKVRIVPRQPRTTMHAWYAAADVLASPRISGENVPLKVFDYLAANRPIVATDIPTHRTVLDETTSLLAPPDSVEFGNAIARVLEEPELAERLREGAAGYARQHLGWSSFVETLQEIHKVATTPT